MVSVVVPVYNVQRYLDKCVSSILNQTYSDIEVILVDDGSSDRSGDICDRYSLIDKRVKVLHQENAGVGAARNAGIEMAQGELICFVDSDDFLPVDAILILVNEYKRANADLICGTKFTIFAKETVKRADGSCLDFQVGDNEKMFSYLKISDSSFPWAKLFKTDVLRMYDVRFPCDIKIGEDAVFNYRYLQHIDKVVYISKSVYYYNKINAFSATHKYYDDFGKWALQSGLEAVSLFCDKNNCKQNIYAQRIMCKQFISAIKYSAYYSLRNETDDENVTKVKAIYTLFEKYLNTQFIISSAEYEDAELLYVLKCCTKGEYHDLLDLFRQQSKNDVNVFKKVFYRTYGKIKELIIFKI